MAREENRDLDLEICVLCPALELRWFAGKSTLTGIKTLIHSFIGLIKT